FMVAEDDETSNDKEIDKLMALISLSFKKIYKPTNNNLQTSSNTSRANQDNSPRINRGTGFENQRIGNVAGAKETIEQADWRDDTDDESEDQELEAHYMYMAQLQEVSPDAADSGPIFEAKPLQKVSTDDHYNVFSIKSKHPEQSESVHDTYLIEQDEHNMIIDSLDMSYDREQIDQNDDDADLVHEQLLKKCECLEKELSKSKMMSKSFESVQKHAINLELELQQYKEKMKNNKSFKINQSKEFCKEREQYFQIQDLKAQLQDKGIVISELKKLIEKLKGKSVDTNCGKCVLNEKHDMCVFKSINGVISRTKMPIVVPVSTRDLKRTVKQSADKPLKKTVASESNQKPRNITRKLYLIEIVLFIVDSGCSKHMTGNLKLLINFVEKFLGTLKFKNDQIASILRYGDLVQGAITIKRVYYVEGLNHNLFSVGQFCDADLEVAFRKSTCYIRDLKGNDLLTGSRGTDLYSITLQDINSPNPIRLMAKATSSQAWLWHRR
nr:integrase, catalytic region, zinc finger, CCHC-type, peptidase aspartic, catalytic [Tanacetum cinerariifolium]